MSKMDALVKDINKSYKEDIMSRGITRIKFQKIPTSSIRLNYCLYGGIPRNCIIELFGENGGGKTTTALDICKHAQEIFKEEYETALENTADKKQLEYLQARGQKQVLYVDVENTMDEDWASLLGVDVDAMYIVKPQTQAAEDIFEMIIKAVETDEIGLVVLDSLGVMISQSAYEKTMMEKTMAGISAPLTVFAKKMTLLCRRFDCTLIGINQLRDDMSGFGRKITTGGQGWKYACTVRICFEKGKLLDAGGNEIKQSSESPAGNKVEFAIAKTKANKPDRLRGFYPLMYDYGVDEILDFIEIGMKVGAVDKAGAWFKLVDIESGEIVTDEEGNELKIQGQANVAQYLSENEELFLDLQQKVVNSLL